MPLSQDYLDRFGGLARLYGDISLSVLAAARVIIVGLGGVGSWTAEALARSGIGHLLLIDGDDLCVTNTNRQIHAIQSTVGLPKAEVLALRMREINPEIQVETILSYLSPKNLDLVTAWKTDLVIDAVDAVRVKKDIYLACRDSEIPLIMAGAAGGKTDPTTIRCTDLGETTHDGLLRRVRKLLRQEDRAPPEGDRFGAQAVFFAQNAVFPAPDGTICATAPKGSSLRLDCSSGFGTACFLTASMGMTLAGEAIRLMLADKKAP